MRSEKKLRLEQEISFVAWLAMVKLRGFLRPQILTSGSFVAHGTEQKSTYVIRS